ncbi:hypothetical protein C7212DRAFT_352543 [Tuber magnatum]|uniref:Uncharacterized protein n=1 Tax=Tuber magnatum TaxID=42249 RepID=A0A317SYF8_9PEZI|nr:hypothetical protein C7212DRAFT_352543 [Tuber magnatum]
MLPDASLLSLQHNRPRNNNYHTSAGSFSAADACGGGKVLGPMGNNYNMEGHLRKYSSSSSISLPYTYPSSDHFDLKHSNTPGISRPRAPGLRITIPGMEERGRDGSGGGSIISSVLPSYSSFSSSSVSLDRSSERTLTASEYHTDNIKPKKVESCVPMHSLNKIILRQKKSVSDYLSGMKPVSDYLSGVKSSLKAFLGAKSSRDEESLQKICYSLVNLPEEEISSRRATRSENLGCTVFKRQSLTLFVKALRNRQFELMLPSVPETMSSRDIESLLAGDAEEQGHGGSFERFVSMLPESCRDISEKASPLGLVPKLLPYGEISANARYIGSCFWMWLCIIDDLTETLTGEAWGKAESDLLRIFSEHPQENPPSPCSTTTITPPPSDLVQVSMALRTVIDETALHEFPTNSSSTSNHINDDQLWRPMFLEAVREVILGFRAERPLLGNNSTSKIDLAEWMRVRIITISVRPFMIIARASLGLDPTLSPLGNPLAENYQDLLRTSKESNRNNLAKVECLLQLIMGLQNDIIGWDKDHKTRTPLNTIQILIKGGTGRTKALAQVVAIHNELVEHLANYGDWVWNETFRLPPLTPLPGGQFLNHRHGDANGDGLAGVSKSPSVTGFFFPLLLPPPCRDPSLTNSWVFFVMDGGWL